jgi:DAPG hydrolase PhiG domain
MSTVAGDRMNTAVEVEQGAVFLDPSPHALEMGVQRLPSGQLLVAARTPMPGCAGRMFEWWFRFAPDTRQYAWWHPLDHVSSRWIETSPRTHVGSTHLVEERLGADEVYELQVHFIDPAELFGAAAVEEAFDSGHVSAIVAAQLGMGADPIRDERGRPNMGRMAHIARDTPDGMVLRSRFWLGAGSGLPAEQLEQMIPDAIGLGLMQHAYTEFTFLSRILPPLYAAENRDTEPVPLPW